MPRLTFENKITLGNAIQIVLICFAVIAAYFGIVGRVDGSARDIASLQQSVDAVPDLSGRVSTIETRINIGQAQREQFQDKTEAALEKLAAQQSQMMALLSGIIARMDEAEKSRR